MKLVDEKGKLFGKINVIDLLVIVVIIAILAVIGMKVLGVGDNAPGNNATSNPGTTAETNKTPEQHLKLLYTVRVTAQNENVAEQLALYVDADADKKTALVVGANELEAYVVDYRTEPSKYIWSGTTGTVEPMDAETAEEAGLVDIIFSIEANVSETYPNLVGSQDVRIGKNHIVKTGQMEFMNGAVESCVWEQVG